MKSTIRRCHVSMLFLTVLIMVAASAFFSRVASVGLSYGNEWTNLSAGEGGKGLRAVAVDPLNPKKVFIGSAKGVFVSSDAGKEWVNCLDLSSSKKDISAELSAAQKLVVEGLQAGGKAGEVSGVTALAIDPANPQKVFAGSVDGLYICADGGKSWTKGDGALKGLSLLPLSIAIDPSNPDMVYAGTLNQAVIKSKDGGKTWQPVEVGAGEKTVTAVAVHPFDSQVVYAGTPDGVFKSKNGGSSWERVLSQSKVTQSVSVDLVNPEIVYLGTSGGVYKSVDGGASWKEIGSDVLAKKNVKKLAVAPSDSKALYAATTDGVYGSADGGAKWQDLSKGTGLKDAMSLAFDPLDSGAIWAATATGLYKTALAKPEAAAPGAAVAAEVKGGGTAAEGAKKAEEVAPAQTAPVEENVETIAVEEPSGAKAGAAAGPSVPTIDDVKTVLGQFSHEPTVQEVQEVAMRWAEVHPDLIEGWRKGAKYRALLPEFTLGFGFDHRVTDRWLDMDEVKEYNRREYGSQLGDTVNINTTGDVSITSSEYSDKFYLYTQTIDRHTTQDTTDRKRNIDFKFKWDLGDFLYNPDQVRISDEVRDLVELRNDVLEEVTQFYFQRRQLQIDLLLSPSEDLRERLRLELQLQEVTANIDYLTGGYLTQRLNDVKVGKERKSNVIKRLFAI
ncbi:MAG: YCF48-related protein [Candidatus Aureabacteria bacterium]|nr:YCF48-related protein [Candidatus Auribacterota bacterium]